MTKPINVRLAIAEFRDHWHSELFTETGGTEGDCRPADPQFDEQLGLSRGGLLLPTDHARDLGLQLFDVLLGGPNNSPLWAALFERAQIERRVIYLNIDAAGSSVRDLPFGLLFDRHNQRFLFREYPDLPTVKLVRIHRGCSPRPLQINAERPELLAIASVGEQSSPTKGEMSAALARLFETIVDMYEVWICAPDGVRQIKAAPSQDDTASFVSTTPEQIRAALEAREYDMLHLLAHGERSGYGFQLCGAEPEVSPQDLARWCRHRTQLAFLQVCGGSRTQQRDMFGGLAQQLLNPKGGGDLAAVVASAFPLELDLSTDVAVDFYREFLACRNPVDAIRRASDRENPYHWATLEPWVRPMGLASTAPPTDSDGERAPAEVVASNDMRLYCPFRGLQSYREHDRGEFKGRTEALLDITGRLEEESFIAILGEPGSGKSSLLDAGIAPWLRQESPNRYAISKIDMREVLASGVEVDRSDGGDQPMLLLDHCERLVTLDDHPEQGTEVASHLADWVRGGGQIVATMQTQYATQFIALCRAQGLKPFIYVLSPPNEVEFREIIEAPARESGIAFQDQAVEAVLRDPLFDPRQAAGEHAREAADADLSVLPFLSAFLRQVWLKAAARQAPEITLDHLQAVGGVAGAVERHVETVYQQCVRLFPVEARPATLIRDFFLTLVRRGKLLRCLRSKLEDDSGYPVQMSEVIDVCLDERILTATQPDQTGKSHLQISHQVLLRSWRRLRDWLAEDKPIWQDLEFFSVSPILPEVGSFVSGNSLASPTEDLAEVTFERDECTRILRSLDDRSDASIRRALSNLNAAESQLAECRDLWRDAGEPEISKRAQDKIKDLAQTHHDFGGLTTDVAIELDGAADPDRLRKLAAFFYLTRAQNIRDRLSADLKRQVVEACKRLRKQRDDAEERRAKQATSFFYQHHKQHFDEQCQVDVEELPIPTWEPLYKELQEEFPAWHEFYEVAAAQEYFRQWRTEKLEKQARERTAADVRRRQLLRAAQTNTGACAAGLFFVVAGVAFGISIWQAGRVAPLDFFLLVATLGVGGSLCFKGASRAVSEPGVRANVKPAVLWSVSAVSRWTSGALLALGPAMAAYYFACLVSSDVPDSLAMAWYSALLVGLLVLVAGADLEAQEAYQILRVRHLYRLGIAAVAVCITMVVGLVSSSSPFVMVLIVGSISALIVAGRLIVGGFSQEKPMAAFGWGFVAILVTTSLSLLVWFLIGLPYISVGIEWLYASKIAGSYHAYAAIGAVLPGGLWATWLIVVDE